MAHGPHYAHMHASHGKSHPSVNDWKYNPGVCDPQMSRQCLWAAYIIRFVPVCEKCHYRKLYTIVIQGHDKQHYRFNLIIGAKNGIIAYCE